MQFFFPKFSILGIVLLSASAVVAAIFPSANTNRQERFILGSLTDDSLPGNMKDSSITCAPDSAADIVIQACNASTIHGSETTLGNAPFTPDSTSVTIIPTLCYIGTTCWE